MQLIDEILEYLQYHPMSSRLDVEGRLSSKVSSATVKRQIARGIENGLIVSHGNNRSTVYAITPKAHILRTVNLDSYYAIDIDKRDVQTGYNFDLIRTELPRIDIFSVDEKTRLDECQKLFTAHMKEMVPGSVAYNRELERLGIDLSWKSSQIEGNTYTLIETETLLKDLKEAKGRTHAEAQMLLNHKSALKAIIANPGYFERLSLARIEDIHSVLVEDMGVEPSLRHRRVRITGTKYQPLDVESQIREAVDDMCALINGKADPYEKRSRMATSGRAALCRMPCCSLTDIVRSRSARLTRTTTARRFCFSTSRTTSRRSNASSSNRRNSPFTSISDDKRQREYDTILYNTLFQALPRR